MSAPLAEPLGKTAAPAPEITRGKALFGLLSLALTICCASSMRVIFSPVQDLAKAELNLSDFQLSLLQGLAVSVPVALLSLPVGRLTDRGNRLRLLLVMALVWTTGSIATAFATGFYSLFVARMLAGIGAMCAVPVVISMAADLSTPERRGRSLLFLSIGNIGGGAIAFAAGGWLLGWLQTAAAESGGLFAALAPWRGVHLWFGLASLVLIMPLLALREPRRHELGEAPHAELRPALREIWAHRRLLGPLFLGQVTVVMADTAATIWAAPVLTRDYGVLPEQFAGWMGLVLLGAGTAGSLIGGFAADAGHRSRIGGGILLGAVAAAWLSIPGACFALAPGTVSFALLLTLLLTCGTVTGLVASTAIAVLLPNEIRGVCLGAFVVIGAIVGLGFAPTAVTLVSTAMGGEESLRYALAISIGVTSLLAALGFTGALRSARVVQPPDPSPAIA